MKRLFLSTLLVALPVSAMKVASPSKPGSIQGTWRAVEVTLPGPTPRTITSLQPNLIILSTKYYSRVHDQAENPRPTLTDPANATADELRAAWGPIVAEAGTYEVSGNVITMRPVVAKNPAATARGVYLTYSYRMVGDSMWITETRSIKGPVENGVKIKIVRVE